MADMSPELLAKESERLRTDQAFAEAVKAAQAAAIHELKAAEADAIEALLANESTEGPKIRIVQARATIAAIDGLTTAIAHQILKGTARERVPVA